MVCTLGLPRTTPTACGPCSRAMAGSARAIASNASAQLASVRTPSLRTSGARSRSGSSSSPPMEAPLGQMNPLLNTSSRSPRAPVTLPSSMVSVSPQVASQRGQMRRAVRELLGSCDMGPPGRRQRWRADMSKHGRAYRPVRMLGRCGGEELAPESVPLSPAPARGRPAPAHGSRRRSPGRRTGRCGRRVGAARRRPPRRPGWSAGGLRPARAPDGRRAAR